MARDVNIERIETVIITSIRVIPTLSRHLYIFVAYLVVYLPAILSGRALKGKGEKNGHLIETAVTVGRDNGKGNKPLQIQGLMLQ